MGPAVATLGTTTGEANAIETEIGTETGIGIEIETETGIEIGTTGNLEVGGEVVPSTTGIGGTIVEGGEGVEGTDLTMLERLWAFFYLARGASQEFSLALCSKDG